MLEHKFVTKSGAFYHGYSLQLPKKSFPNLTDEKHKSLAYLKARRDEKMLAWAAAYTILTPAAAQAWVEGLDRDSE